MRHRDDDLEPFREDPVVRALTGPATPQELAGEADALAAYREAVPVPQQRRRSAARIATGASVTVLVVGLSGGVAAAYANYLPDSWQQKLHDEVHSIPAPEKKAPKPPVALNSPTPITPSQPAPTPTVIASSPDEPSPTATPTASHTPSPSTSPTLPIGVPSASVTPSATPTISPTTTPTASPPPTAAAGQVAITVTPGRQVTYGTQLTVKGALTDAAGNPIADRRVVLVERFPGQPGRHRAGVARTSVTGEVTFTAPPVHRNVRLVLRAGHHLRSAAQQVVVVPIIHVEVPPTAPGETSVTVRVAVAGGQQGDALVIRGPGARDLHRATLDASGSTTLSLPASPSQTVHYRAVVRPTRAHGGHELAFYVPPTGS